MIYEICIGYQSSTGPGKDILVADIAIHVDTELFLKKHSLFLPKIIHVECKDFYKFDQMTMN